MISIYNKTKKCTYTAHLRKWNESESCFDPDILQEIDTDLAKKWDSMIEMYVMDHNEVKGWCDFWNYEVEEAACGNSDLLDDGEYVFFCEKDIVW